MRLTFVFLLFCAYYSAWTQLPIDEQQFLTRLKPGGELPAKLLSTRTAVFHPYTMNTKELEMLQQWFQRIGVDPTVYFESDLVAAGRDVSVGLAEYLNKREITNLILFQKNETGFKFFVTEFNKKANLVEQNQYAWTSENKSLEELLRTLYRTAANSLKRENLLINDVPETGFSINTIDGRRSEFFAIDLKVDELAVPKFGDEAKDKELEEIMKSYPYKYKLMEAGMSESEMRKQGMMYVLRFVHARDKVAKNVLGYDMTKSQSAIVSVTYPDTQPQLKNIPANTDVYKFYFKHIDSGNVFLGTKWDADLTWQQALINQLKGFKAELKIN
ncbi:MAG: hypothetical protein ACOYXT_27800 [Bacteroidota bacterium]